jgi:hypothetical protein
MGVILVVTIGVAIAAAYPHSVPASAELIFSAEPQVVDRGGLVTLRWNVPGSSSVMIEQRYGNPRTVPQRSFDHLPAQGSMVVDLSTVAPGEMPYIHSVDFWLWNYSNVADGGTPGQYSVSSVSVQINCPFNLFFFGEDPSRTFCPLAKAEQVEAVYQRFESGFLMWRGDNQTTLIGRTDPNGERAMGGSALRFDPDASPSFPLTPLPIDSTVDLVFRDFLTEQAGHGILIGLGEPLAPAEHYDATIQESYSDSLASVVTYLTLPDDRVMRYEESIYSAHWALLSDAPSPACAAYGCGTVPPADGR